MPPDCTHTSLLELCPCAPAARRRATARRPARGQGSVPTQGLLTPTPAGPGHPQRPVATRRDAPPRATGPQRTRRALRRLRPPPARSQAKSVSTRAPRALTKARPGTAAGAPTPAGAARAGRPHPTAAQQLATRRRAAPPRPPPHRRRCPRPWARALGPAGFQTEGNAEALLLPASRPHRRRRAGAPTRPPSLPAIRRGQAPRRRQQARARGARPLPRAGPPRRDASGGPRRPTMAWRRLPRRRGAPPLRERPQAGRRRAARRGRLDA